MTNLDIIKQAYIEATGMTSERVDYIIEIIKFNKDFDIYEVSDEEAQRILNDLRKAKYEIIEKLQNIKNPQGKIWHENYLSRN